jgi:hypothetical protein
MRRRFENVSQRVFASGSDGGIGRAATNPVAERSGRRRVFSRARNIAAPQSDRCAVSAESQRDLAHRLIFENE